MSLVERYLLRQLALPVVGAVLALVAVVMLSESLRSLDLIVERGQSAWVLLKVTFLALPLLMSIILPIAVFVGGLIALNRLHTEHEIVVCFAGGMSRWRVIQPAVRLAVYVALIGLVVNLFVQPLAQRAMREQLFKVRTDLASTLVREGEFTRASDELTVYAQRIDQNGLLRELFIFIKTPVGDTTYTASEGRIVSRDGSPALLMRKGSMQEFSSAGVLNYLAFDEYVFDLGAFVVQEDYLHYEFSDRFLHELFFPQANLPWEQQNRLKMLAEGHSRLASPLYAISFMMLALAGVIGGSFSRTGYGRRIAIVAAAAGVTRIVGFGVQSACDDAAWLNVLQYLVPLVPAFFAWRVLFRQKVQRLVSLSGTGPELKPIGGLS